MKNVVKYCGARAVGWVFGWVFGVCFRIILKKGPFPEAGFSKLHIGRFFKVSGFAKGRKMPVMLYITMLANTAIPLMDVWR